MVIKSQPQILKRVSVRWLPNPSYEDSDTVALNVGGYFMDLRVADADGSLQWSRAGKRIQLSSCPLTFRWTRIIDSFGSTQGDEAAFVELPNGDDLETGRFLKDGVLTDYEEVWRDVTPKNAKSSCAWILQSHDGKQFLGRVGNMFMAMRQFEDGSFNVRRETFSESSQSWEIAFGAERAENLPRTTDVLMVEALLRDDSKTPGQAVTVGGQQWVVRGLSLP